MVKDKDIPVNVQKLLACYPDTICGYRDNKLLFASGAEVVYDDGQVRTPEQMREYADVKDQYFFPYSKGKMQKKPQLFEDPARFTSMAFFKAMYGNTEEEVKAKLVSIPWAPGFGGGEILATSVNGVAEKLQAVGEKLDDDPSLEPYLTDIGGTFTWRVVAGTKQLSLHSFGVAIDINVQLSNYWQWDCKCTDETRILGPYQNKIPQKIVDVFEEYGFVWGGKWYHYDTMHFEYRPEMMV